MSASQHHTRAWKGRQAGRQAEEEKGDTATAEPTVLPLSRTLGLARGITGSGRGMQPREGCMVQSRLVRVGRVLASAASCDASSIIRYLLFIYLLPF